MKQQPYIVFGSPWISQEEIDAVTQTLQSGWIGTGPRVHEFEEQFRSYLGARHTVAVSSCTAALHLSMLASGIEPGSEVITTPLTFVATANAILHAKAIPVFVDVDRETMNLDVKQIESRITARTKAILPVHLAGRPCEMDAIHEIARKHGLLVIEDAAHAIEAAYHGRKVGTISPLTCFSFYVTKNMTTIEGGMVSTDSEETAARIKMYALHGLSTDAWSRFSDRGYKHYEVVYPGFKYNLTDVQAAIGLCQLRKLTPWLARREEIWKRYDESFSDLPCFLPASAEAGTVHARHLYTLLIDIDQCDLTRDQVMTSLHQRGIGTGVHYRSLHTQEYYRERFGYRAEDYPNAAWISERTISLPLSAKLIEEEIERVIQGVREALGSASVRRPASRGGVWRRASATEPRESGLGSRV